MGIAALLDEPVVSESAWLKPLLFQGCCSGWLR
jgi:hypothetical protein